VSSNQLDGEEGEVQHHGYSLGHLDYAAASESGSTHVQGQHTHQLEQGQGVEQGDRSHRMDLSDCGLKVHGQCQ